MDQRKVAGFWAKKAQKHIDNAARHCQVDWKIADEFARAEAIDAIECARKMIKALDAIDADRAAKSIVD